MSGDEKVLQGHLWAVAAQVIAVRDLHRPVPDDDVPFVCADCGDDAGHFRWPCSTARIVYSDDEMKGATA